MVAAEYSTISSRLSRLEKEKEIEEQQLAFFKSESMVEAFDKRIAAVPINAVSIEREITRLERTLQGIRREITDRTKADNSVVTSLYHNIVKYATELGVWDSDTIAASYIFTSNLKELFGAVLHKTVFAFRLAYIIEIQNALGIKLPIILDSPSGKEVDQANIQLMVDILKRDFADNQIIIASIFTYAFDNVNTIEIKKRLLEWIQYFDFKYWFRLINATLKIDDIPSFPTVLKVEQGSNRGRFSVLRNDHSQKPNN